MDEEQADPTVRFTEPVAVTHAVVYDDHVALFVEGEDQPALVVFRNVEGFSLDVATWVASRVDGGPGRA
jgi:hypothetical protein